MPASPRQAQFIKSLTESRSQAIVADGKSPEAILALLDRLDTRGASSLIDVLMAMPENPRQASPLDAQRIEQVAALRAALPTMSGGDASFARSLVEQWDRKGHLSDKQWACVEKLAAATPSKVTTAPTPGVYSATDGTIAKVVLSQAGRPYAKRLIGVTTGGRLDWAYDAQLVHRLGDAVAVDDATVRAAACRLQWGAEPGSDQLLMLARAHAHDRSTCMFCLRPLTDEEDGRSVAVGYGPVCAEKYNLPWGVPVTA
jgi:hypothetical protein